MNSARYRLAIAVTVTLLLGPVSAVPAAALAFIGPASGLSAGSGSGALGVGSGGIVSVGTSTPNAATRFLVVASSTGDTGNYALKVLDASQNPLLIIRNDGSVGIGTATFTNTGLGAVNVGGLLYSSNGFTGSLSAANVSAGQFGANTGGGVYSFPGSVGIGGAASVGAGLLLSYNGAAENGLEFVNTQSGGKSWYLGDNEGGGAGTFGLYDLTSNTAPFTVLGNGNVGIGTVTPSEPLSVTGVAQATQFNVVDSNAVIYRNGNDLDLKTFAGYNILMQPSGNVGIGTTAPSYKLQVLGTSGTNNLGATAPSGYVGNIFQASIVGVTNGFSVTNDASNNLTYSMLTGGQGLGFYQSAAGNVGIGTSNPTSTLSVNGSATISGNLIVGGTFGGQALTGILNAGNVSAGTFGSNAGWGNFIFANNVGIDDNTNPANNLVVGPGGGTNLNFDGNQIWALNNGASSPLYLQYASTGNTLINQNGGDVQIGGTSGDTGVKLYVQGAASATGWGVGELLDTGTSGAFLGIVQNGVAGWSLGIPYGTTSFALRYGGINGSQPFTVASGGNVGIGTTAPNYRLQVTSGANDIAPGAGILVTASDYSTNGGYLLLNKNSGNGSYASIQSGDNNAYRTLALNQNGGNVGIDTTNPTSTLQVNGTANITGNLTVGGTFGGQALTGTLSAANVASGEFGANTGDGTFTFPAALNVDGGSSSNWGELNIGGDPSINAAGTIYGYGRICTGNNSGDCNSTGGVILSPSGSNAWGNVYITGSGNTFFDGGNVGIGTTSPGQTLQVNGATLFNTGTGATAFNDVNIGGIGGWAGGEAHRINFIWGTPTSMNNFATIEASFDGTNGRLNFRNVYAGGAQTGVAMTIMGNSAGTGNVGISNTNPGYLLTVGSGGGTGKEVIDSQDNVYGQLEIGNPASGGEASIGFISGVTGWGSSVASQNGSSYIWDIGADPWGIGGNEFGIGNQNFGGPIIAVQAGGNVGIDTTAPNGKLDIYNSGDNGDGAVFSPDINADNNFTIQTYIDSEIGGGWAGRTTYASGCCNNLALQPDVGTVTIGGTTGGGDGQKLYVNGNAEVTGTLTSGAFTGTLNAANISAGTFGNNTGGGTYSFPGPLNVDGTILGDQYLDLNAYPGYGSGTGQLYYDGATGMFVTNENLNVYGGTLDVGPASTTNVEIDQNQVWAENNGAVSTLYLNYSGGLVNIGGGSGASLVVNGNVNAVAFGANDYEVSPANGLGICFWDDCTNYVIAMGTGSYYNYGSVTGYSVRNTMYGNGIDGWTWGPAGSSPTASLDVNGNMEIAGNLTLAASSAYVQNGGIYVGSSAYANQAGDLGVSRNAAPTTGAIYLGSGGSHYLFFDGTNYNFGGTAGLYTSGNIENTNPSLGYLALTGDLPGYSTGQYPTLKTNYAYMYFSANGNYTAALGGNGIFQLNGSANVVLNASGNSYFTGGYVGIGTTGPDYTLEVNGDAMIDGWLRTSGQTGWYNQTYSIGWYATDGTWDRTYGGASVWTSSGLLGTNGGITSGYGGTGPNTSGGAIIAGNVGIGLTSPDEALQVNGHISTTQSSGGPTASCGSGGYAAGDDTAGTIYIGSGSGSSCTVTFKTSFAGTPVCTITPMNAGPQYPLGGGPYAHSDTWISYIYKTEFIFNQETNMTNGDSFMYLCIGT